MPPALSTEDFDDLHDFIKVRVAAGYTPIDEIVDDAVEVFADVSVDSTALREAARAVTDLAVKAHLDEQRDWPDVTDCDRLDAAFAELDANGIVARQHFACCGTCGSQEIRGEMEQAEKLGTPARGFTFFHMQDTEHAIAGESLYLSFGTYDRDEPASIGIGHEIVQTLTAHGLSPWWNGKFAHRIALPVVWQRRRAV